MQQIQISQPNDGTEMNAPEVISVTDYTAPTVVDSSLAERKVASALAKLSKLTGQEYTL